MNRYRNSWAILPATMALWNKRTITIPECASVWEDGTVLVCTNEEGRVCFIHGSAGDYGVKIGEYHACHHDQTGVHKGLYKIINILNWKKVKGEVVIESQLPFNRETRASLAVFK